MQKTHFTLRSNCFISGDMYKSYKNIPIVYILSVRFDSMRFEIVELREGGTYMGNHLGTWVVEHIDKDN